MDNPADSPEVLERFHEGLALVDIIARQVGRTVGQAVELEELVSYGREGLLDAARRFDPSRGVPFRGYANYRVRGAMIDGVRSMARLPRRVHERLGGLAAASQFSEGKLEDLGAPIPPGSTAAHAERALSEHLAGMATAVAMGLLSSTATDDEGRPTTVSSVDSPEEQLGRAELLEALKVAIGELPTEEAELVRRHYLENERFDLVAKELGLSKSWASRLHTRAVAKLTKRLRSLAE